MPYEYATEPYAHQREEFEENRDKKNHALFWEMGCVDADTEFLGPEGWVRIADWNGEMVAQWDWTRKAEFVQASYIDEPSTGFFEFTGSRGINMVLCAHHRMPILGWHEPELLARQAAHLIQGGETLLVPTHYALPGGDVEWSSPEQLEHARWRRAVPGERKYCFRVPSGYWIARRNGVVFPTGNCGKSKPTIDTIAHLYESGEITAALVLAPKAVAPNWSRKEVPIHLPERLKAKTRVILYRSDKVRTQKFQREIAAALAWDGLLIVCMSYDGVMAKRKPGAKQIIPKRTNIMGYELAMEVLRKRPTAFILDESARIKNPSAKRTKRVVSMSNYAKFRRILTGTPIANKPFDVYSQVQFLDPFFWAKHGCKGWPAFKAKYGVWITRLRDERSCPHPEERRPNCGCLTYPDMVRYQNLDNLHDVMASVGTRLLKEDVLDLPPQLYDTRNFDLPPAQQRLYNELADKFMVMLSNGDMITAPLVLTQLLRLQQITSGYCPTDDGDLVVDHENKRPELLAELVEDCPHSMIVWAKFDQDFVQITKVLKRMGVSYMEYQGSTPHHLREEAVDRFQAKDIKVFLGKPSCAGEGLTLTAAQTVCYYNSTYSLSERLQSESRAHRSGQEHPVQYIDLIAEGTVDEKIIGALRAKKDLSDLIMGDPRGGWL